jgi:hypothetical protein
MRKLRAAVAGLVLVSFGLDSRAQEAKGTVYIYRLPSAYGALGNPKIFVDEKEVGKIRNGRFFSVTVPTGHHVLTSTRKDSGIDIDVQSGQTYYVKTDMTYGNGFSINPAEVSLVAPEQGRYAVGKLKPAERGDLKVDFAHNK